jgi:hypothetical protein
MYAKALVLASLFALAASLFLNAGHQAGRALATAPDWPTHFQGKRLQSLPLHERERAFLGGFPGAVARFTDGEHEIVMRWVTQPTRELHPAADCYRGIGFQIGRQRVVNDAEDAQWRCFDARRGSARSEVCERIIDGAGRGWTDVSAWYWAAALGQSEGPWLVTTVASAGAVP